MAWQKHSQKFYLASLTVALIISSPLFPQNAQSAEDNKELKRCWEELGDDPQYSISQSFRFYRLKTDNGSLATLVVFDLKDRSFAIKPFLINKQKLYQASLRNKKPWRE